MASFFGPQNTLQQGPGQPPEIQGPIRTDYSKGVGASFFQPLMAQGRFQQTMANRFVDRALTSKNRNWQDALGNIMSAYMGARLHKKATKSVSDAYQDYYRAEAEKAEFAAEQAEIARQQQMADERRMFEWKHRQEQEAARELVQLRADTAYENSRRLADQGAGHDAEADRRGYSLDALEREAIAFEEGEAAQAERDRLGISTDEEKLAWEIDAGIKPEAENSASAVGSSLPGNAGLMAQLNEAFGKPPVGYTWDIRNGALQFDEHGSPAMRPFQGSGKDEMAVEAAAKANSARQSLQALDEYRSLVFNEDGTLNKKKVGAQLLGLPNSEGRTARAKALQMVESQIRLESGAAVPETEVVRAAKRFIPHPFDSTETAKAKLDMLQGLIEGNLRLIDPAALKGLNPEEASAALNAGVEQLLGPETDADRMAAEQEANAPKPVNPDDDLQSRINSFLGEG